MAEIYLFAKLFSPNTFYLANSPNINPTKHSPHQTFPLYGMLFIYVCNTFSDEKLVMALPALPLPCLVLNHVCC